MKEDIGVIFAVVIFILAILFMIGSIIYSIYQESITNYEVTVYFNSGVSEEYTCTSYENNKDCYVLFLNKNTKLVLLKSSIESIGFKKIVNNKK